MFFRNLLDPTVQKSSPVSVFMVNPRIDIGTPLQETSLELEAAEPGIYGIITVLDPRTLEDFFTGMTGSPASDLYISVEVIRTDGGNTLTANLPEQPVRFVEAFSADRPVGSVIMVKFDSSSEVGGWHEVIAPDRISLQ